MNSELYSQIKNLYKESFFDEAKETTDLMFKYYYNKNDVSYYLLDKELISCGFLLEKNMYFFKDKIKIYFLVGLCTKEEFRGKGYIKKVIIDLFYKAIKKGGFLVFLYPFKHDYYERFDFKTINYCEKVVINSNNNKYDVINYGKNSGKINYNLISMLSINNKFNTIQQYYTSEELKLKAKIFSYEYDEILIKEGNEIIAYLLANENEIEFYVTKKYDAIRNCKKLNGKSFVDLSSNINPYVMGRVINAKIFFEYLSGNGINYSCEVKDEIININNAFFCNNISNNKKDNTIKINIGDLLTFFLKSNIISVFDKY